MSLYELMQNDLADPLVRRAAAEALVTLGLLRPVHRGPSLFFMWLVGIALLVMAVGAASWLGAWAVLLFAVGVGALAAYAVLQRCRSEADVYSAARRALGASHARNDVGSGPRRLVVDEQL
jgi:protein-S-isoprenylcysteine O-methyltransferase Ste14